MQLGEALQLQVDDRLLVVERDFVEGDGVAVAAAAGLGDGVAAGCVAGGAPVVGGELAGDAVELDRPRERVQVVPEAPGVVLLYGPPFALAGDRGRFAGLCDLEAAAGERVQEGRCAVVLRVAGEAGGVLGDQPVAVELGEAVRDGAGRAVGERGAADERPGCEPGAIKQGEDRVVLVVEAREVGGAVELVGGADLVDAVEERELAQAVGRRPVLLARRGPGYPASDDAPDGAVVEPGRLAAARSRPAPRACRRAGDCRARPGGGAWAACCRVCRGRWRRRWFGRGWSRVVRGRGRRGRSAGRGGARPRRLWCRWARGRFGR